MEPVTTVVVDKLKGLAKSTQDLAHGLLNWRHKSNRRTPVIQLISDVCLFLIMRILILLLGINRIFLPLLFDGLDEKVGHLVVSLLLCSSEILYL